MSFFIWVGVGLWGDIRNVTASTHDKKILPICVILHRKNGTDAGGRGFWRFVVLIAKEWLVEFEAFQEVSGVLRVASGLGVEVLGFFFFFVLTLKISFSISLTFFFPSLLITLFHSFSFSFLHSILSLRPSPPFLPLHQPSCTPASLATSAPSYSASTAAPLVTTPRCRRW